MGGGNFGLRTFGRATVPLFQKTLAKAIGRDKKYVGRELRRLIVGGIVVEHEAASRGKPAVLSLDLDSDHWKPVFRDAASFKTPKTKATMTDASLKASKKTPHQASKKTPNVEFAASEKTPALKTLKRDLKGCFVKAETPKSRCDSGPCAEQAHLEITVPELQELQRSLAADHSPSQPHTRS